MRKLIKNRGFTDRLYFYNFRTVWIFTAACFVLNALRDNLGITEPPIVSYKVPVAFGELGLHTRFIIWKAKTENCRKNKDFSKLTELEENEL